MAMNKIKKLNAANWQQAARFSEKNVDFNTFSAAMVTSFSSYSPSNHFQTGLTIIFFLSNLISSS